MEPIINRHEENALAFRKPWGMRIIFGLFALLLTAGYPLLLALPGPRVPMNALGWLAFGFMEVMSLPFALLCLYFSGPQHLMLNFDRRSYRYVCGWPLLAQAQEGPWEDIAGVYVWDRNRGRLSGYSVGIIWKNKPRSHLSRAQTALLATFDGLGRLDRANNLADEIGSLLSVPRVEPPFRRTPRK